MTAGKIIKQEPASMAFVKNTLEKIKERDEELSFRSAKTYDYLNSFTLDQKKSEDLAKKIADENIPRLKPEHITKLVDLMPQTPEETKVILHGYAITVTPENLKKIVKILHER